MPRLTYLGTEDPSDHHETTAFGVTFRRDEPVTLDSLPDDRLKTHPLFLYEDDDGPSLKDLRAALDAKGIGYHHRMGVAKLQTLLDGAE